MYTMTARGSGQIHYAALLTDAARRLAVHASGDIEKGARQAARAVYARVKEDLQ